MNKPHVIINCAMSADGKIALPSGKQLRISCDKDIKRMYKLRDKCDAVLVGINTIISDDPKLTIKRKYVEQPRNPIRIILDVHCKTPVDAHAVDDVAKTFVITAEKCNKKYGNNVEVIQFKADQNGFIDLERLLDFLYDRGIRTLMVEGGSTVIWNFLKERLADDLYVYIAPIIVGGKYTPTIADGEGIKNIDELISLKIVETSRIDPGILIHYKMIK